MHRLLRAGILITFGMLIIGIIGGCGDDGTEDIMSPPESEADVGPLSTTYVVIDPLPQGNVVIPQCIEFTLTFNEEVVAGTVNETPATGSGLNWEWFGGSLSEGTSALKIMWTNRDGSKAFAVAGPAHVVSGCPGGDSSRNYPVVQWQMAMQMLTLLQSRLAASGLTLMKMVQALLSWTDEAGADLNWSATVSAQTATLTAVTGQETGQRDNLQD